MGMMIARPTQALADNEPEDPEVSQKIKLEAESDDERTKSLMLPCEAWQTGSQVTVTALTGVSNAVFSIYDAGGMTVATDMCPLAKGESVLLDVTGQAAGMYTLVIELPTGMYLTGTFVLF